MPEPRTWTLEFPPGMQLISLNDRYHWAEKGRRAKLLREAGWWLARQQQIPPLLRASFVVEYRPPDRRRRDNDNIPAGSGKHAIDGIVQARVLIDDSQEYVEDIRYRLSDVVVPKGQLVIHITEVLEAA